jgi:hypothetical protein
MGGAVQVSSIIFDMLFVSGWLVVVFGLYVFQRILF